MFYNHGGGYVIGSGSATGQDGTHLAQLYFAITTSPIWRDAIKIAETKVAQRAAPVYMYQLAYKNPDLVPGTDFPLGSPHASDINLKFANTDKNLDFFLSADQSPGRLATARHMSELWPASPARAVPPRRTCRDGPPTR